MGDTRLSTTKATYYPPALMPGYMGSFVPVKHGYGSLYQGAHINYFQDHRSDTFAMPSSDWGLVRTPYSPRPDLVAVDKLVHMDRMLRQPKMPLSLVVIDPVRRKEVDDYYMACQLHRDQYRDHSGSLHPLHYFRTAEHLFQCSPALTRTYMKFPQYYVKYRTPTVLPSTLERSANIPSLPNRSLRGRYYKHNDVVYKQ